MKADLATLKKQLRLDDYDGDDELLEGLLAAAEESVANAINRDVSEMMDERTGELPPPIAQAIIMMAVHLYSNPGVTDDRQQHTIPYGLMFLLKPYRRL